MVISFKYRKFKILISIKQLSGRKFSTLAENRVKKCHSANSEMVKMFMLGTIYFFRLTIMSLIKSNLKSVTSL